MTASTPTPVPPSESRWRVPSPYARAAAIDSMGTIAAPLLGSVSIALIAVVLSSALSLRWPNVTLLLLVLATGGFVATVEFSFMARQFAVTPSDLEGWWPDSASVSRREELRREQRYCMTQFDKWSSKGRFAYNLGIVALSLGVVGLLVPPHAPGTGRIVVLSVAGLGFVGELLWVFVGALCDRAPVLPEVGPEP